MSHLSKILDRNQDFIQMPLGDHECSYEIYTPRGSYLGILPNEELENQNQLLERFNQQVEHKDAPSEEIPVKKELEIVPKLNIIKVPVHNTRPFRLLSAQEKIAHVQNGSYLNHYILYPKQELKKTNSDLQDENGSVESTIRNNYRKNDDWSLEMINKAILGRQKQVISSLIKQFGTALMSGKSILNMSLPIIVFEPRSLLERLAEGFLFAPHFLERGGQVTDPLEQFRLAFTFYLSTLCADLNPEKSFNPIIGETFQGVIGGCPVYVEQISHHPPMAAFQMLGQNFQIEGLFEFTAAISTNSVKVRKVGDFKVRFKNTGTEIHVQFPLCVMGGMTFGKRAFSYAKKLQVYDIKHKYYAEVDFDKCDSYKKYPGASIGYFISNIYQVNEKFIEKVNQGLEKNADIKFKEKEHVDTKLDKLEGTWMGSLKIEDKVYWSQGNPWPYKLQYFDNPLPSDSNFRMDLLQLKAGDENKAQEAKIAGEEAQRRDKKLREQKKLKQYK